ncbi:5-oxoprolinase subunit PxpA [Hyunsoonleella sp. SJ7]|uniref:5-oxoprolinase subunit PxpA n=1 Tax=Hyunsoonleella aquatilis TaxID=2762758 RepID=A0A923HEE1_9FLAO|nr:5-oxoprolinase subunit PxpA [Hyunsoonleella aquatilis]
MHNFIIDINADVGEGIGNESQLMPYISSCNIACGGHAGDHRTMQKIVKLAKDHGVKIGAHPSFPDKDNFGRVPMEMSCAALFTAIEDQMDALRHVLEVENLDLHHVKPHGALYNLAAIDSRTATCFVEAMKTIVAPVKLYVPFNSVIAKIAIENNIPIIYEAFADRNYNDDLTLVNRTEANAIIQDPDLMFEHVFRIIKDKKVKTISGALQPIEAHTFCIHGDNHNAVRLVRELFLRLKAKGIQVS